MSAEGRAPWAERRGARAYLLGLAAILFVLAAASSALGTRSYARWFSADPLQGAIHATLAILALLAASSARARARAPLAFAILLLGLGVLGTLTPRSFGYPERLGSALRWEVGENAAHLILGGWGAYVATREEK